MEQFLTALLLINHFLLYSCLVLPFLYEPNKYFLLGYFGYVFVFEVAAICSYNRRVNMPSSNLYLFLITLSGVLNKCILLLLAYLGGLFLLDGSNLSQIMLCVCLLALVVSQILPIISIFKRIKVENSAIRPFRERNMKLSGPCYYRGLCVVLSKCSLEPSDNAAK